MRSIGIVLGGEPYDGKAVTYGSEGRVKILFCHTRCADGDKARDEMREAIVNAEVRNQVSHKS